MNVQDLIEELKELPRDVDVIIPSGVNSFGRVVKVTEVHDCLAVDGRENIVKKTFVILNAR